MTFRTSDILIGGSLVIIGLTEVAHLAGCLLGWSFLSVTDLLLAEVVVCVVAAALFQRFCGSRAERKKVGILAFLILLQILWILTGDRAWLDGDMTVETVNTFLAENAVYTVNPLTGAAYTQGMPLRLKILCLPTLYGTISRWTGIAPVDVVYRLIPVITLLLGYVAYGRLAEVLFPEDSGKRRAFLLLVGILFSVGAYMPGVDGFDIFYGGFRGVTIRAVVLLPYLLSCLMERNYLGAVLCILAEACMVWTLYGAGVCLLVTVAWLVLRALVSRVEMRLTVKRETTAQKHRPGEGDAE